MHEKLTPLFSPTQGIPISRGSSAFYREYVPGPLLQPYVACYWSVTASASPASAGANEAELRVIPDGCVDFVLTVSDRCACGGHLSGVMESAMTVYPETNATLIGVRFRPGGVMRFIRQPLTGLRGEVVRLTDLLGVSAATLYDRLQHSGDLREYIRVLDDAHLRWLAISSDEPFDPVVANVLHEIYRTSGNVALHDLAAREAVSSRHLLRRFAAWTGHSPKLFCRVIRFQRTVTSIARTKGKVHGAQLAYECGYSDQAHLVREFRAFAGMTPHLYARNADMSDLFNTDEAYPPYNQIEPR